MLRDKFATAAMQGLVSCGGIRCDELDVSAKAYQIADAMMKERAKQDFSGDPDLTEFKIIPPQVPTGILESDAPIRRVAISPNDPFFQEHGRVKGRRPPTPKEINQGYYDETVSPPINP